MQNLQAPVQHTAIYTVVPNCTHSNRHKRQASCQGLNCHNWCKEEGWRKALSAGYSKSRRTELGRAGRASCWHHQVQCTCPYWDPGMACCFSWSSLRWWQWVSRWRT